MKQGRWLRFSDTTYSREIIISSYTAAELKLKLNDKVVIYFVKPDGSLRPDKLSIVGIYKTGIEDYDKTFAIGDLKLIQRLNGWQPNQIGGYEIFLQDYHDMEKISDDLYFNVENFPVTWDTKTIKDLYPNIFDWLSMQDITRNVLIGFMIVVAVVNLITCLIILVLERIAPRPRWEGSDNLPFLKALEIGLCQCAALIPGVSRSGATILGVVP